ncbi:MAG TPA: PDZ domain-containing protein [Pyrinomonadaceae bacterium]|nr:PDZ domain-containing protein [Pyrinomonadaceae bacterium]
MLHTRAKSFVLATALFLFLLGVVRAQVSDQRSRAVPEDAPEISYTVSMPRPHTHLFDVEARVRYRASAPAALDLLMPVWTPGSYLVREFERHVQGFEARDGGGRALNWAKTNKNTWRVEAAGAREVRVRYSVYANELGVRTSELNDRRAFWNNANLLMYPDGLLGAPSTLKVEPFGGWKIATGLPAVPGAPNTFRAEDFDVLYDSPFLAGNFKTLTFDVRGVPHRLVIDGEGNYDPERLRSDSQRIIETAAEMMGGLPYRDYTILLLLAAARGGGLEHLNSTALILPRFGFGTEEGRRAFDTLVAHEVFHVWNVKLIRPDALGPFDYTRENYTRLLWVAEGVTNYYETLLVRRAGLMPDRQFLQLMAQEIQKLQQTPGRLKQSLEEASFDAWIEYYRPDENTVNTNVSYYDKGAIVSMLLDLEIRRRSNGARSLDDVMRSLYNDFSRRNRNYTPEDFQRAAEQAAGASLEEFFRRYVRGREELDYNASLAWAGLRLDTSSDPGARPAPIVADLGAALEEKDGRLSVKNVPAGTAAYEQGLSAADQIVAVDGYRATLASLNERLSEKRPGERLALTVFRDDELRTLDIKLGSRAAATYRIVPDASATEQQKRNYQAWLGAPFPQGSRQ